MKAQLRNFFGILVLGFSFIIPAVHANTSTDTQDAVSSVELQAAIEAFGVPTEEAKKATDYSAIMIEEENRASDKNYQDMLIVSDDFFILTPF